MVFDFLEVPWGLGRLPRGPWGGGSWLKVRRPFHARPSWFWHRFLYRFLCRFLIVLGSIWAPSWVSFSAILAPWSAKVGLKTVFDSIHLRKSECSRNSVKHPVSDAFLPNMATQKTQDRSKTGPRSSWIVCGSVLVAICPPKWLPRGATKLGFGW